MLKYKINNQKLSLETILTSKRKATIKKVNNLFVFRNVQVLSDIPHK